MALFPWCAMLVLLCWTPETSGAGSGFLSREGPNLYLNGKSFRGVSVNQVDLLWQFIGQTPENSTVAVSHMRSAQANGFDFFRFSASPFWPKQLKESWVANPNAFWRSFDALVGAATQLRVRLVPSIMWNVFTFSDAVGEPLSALWDEGSRSRRLLDRWTTELVTRYAENTTILFWELSNEFNLLADLDLQNSTSGCAPSMGTPAFRTRADNFSTDMLIELQTDRVKAIKAIDKNHLVEAGNAAPRFCAQHLRESYHQPHRNWSPDTRLQYAQNLHAVNAPPLDLVGIHLYSGKHENMRWNVTAPDSAELVAFSSQIATDNDQPFYLGEFGDKWNGTSHTRRSYTRACLDAVVKHKISRTLRLFLVSFLVELTQVPSVNRVDLGILPALGNSALALLDYSRKRRQHHCGDARG
jgi:Cellulase (glycosyl hydrolase family 5)